jgi:HD-GYP domain-containing protein (c-di-GMP phosphodiesterase class II)
MNERTVISKPEIFSGYAHLGSCQELTWQDNGPRMPASFVMKHLICEYDVEALMLQKDLFLRSRESGDFLIRDFHIIDVGDIDNIQGEGRELKPLHEAFPSVKNTGGSVGVVSQETQLSALKAVASLISEVKTNQTIAGQEANQAVDLLVNDLIRAPEAVLNLLAARSYDDYTFSHNINVATISLFIGQALGLSRDDMQSLGVGALLHDVGKLRVALTVLNKQGRLTNDELREVRRHPVIGFCLLSHSRDVDEKARGIVLQHHEHLVGDGYPRGSRGTQIPFLSRIVAIADVFDAMTTDRPFRAAHSPYEAMNYLLRNTDQRFDPEILHMFLRHLSLYPPGTRVQLNTGQFAIVTKANLSSLLRPVVKLVKTFDGRPIPDGPIIDLRFNPNLFITRISKG